MERGREREQKPFSESLRSESRSNSRSKKPVKTSAKKPDAYGRGNNDSRYTKPGASIIEEEDEEGLGGGNTNNRTSSNASFGKKKTPQQEKNADKNGPNDKGNGNGSKLNLKP